MLVHVKFSQVPPQTGFVYEGNTTWVKAKRPGCSNNHNAWAWRSEGKVLWCKSFREDDIVQVEVMEV